MIRDVKEAFRRLTVRLGTTLIAVVTVGFGVGSLTAVYGIARSLLDQDMTGVSRPDELVAVYVHNTLPQFGQYQAPSYAHYTELRDLQDVFSDLTIYSRTLAVASTDDWAEGMHVEMAEGNFFSLLGLAPSIGRLLRLDDDQPGAPRVAMISHSVWLDRYAGSNQVLGQTLRLNGEMYRIVGVMPRGFVSLTRDWYSPPQVWVTLRPFTSIDAATRRSNLSPAVARLRPGVDIEAANAQLRTLPDRLSRDPADQWEVLGMEAIPAAQARIWPGRRQDTSQLLNMLAVVSGLVLLAASLNVANFFITRFTFRRQELATRLALGATRMRIARLLFVEAVLLAIGAGLVSLGVAMLLLKWLSQAPSIFLRIQLALESGIDSGVAAIAATVLLACTLIFGLLPAVLVSFRNPISELKGNRVASRGTVRRAAPRQVLLTGQIALAVVLTVTAGLYGRSLWNAAQLDPGYPTDSMLLTQIVAQAVPFEDRGPFYETFLSRLNSHPNVVAASIGWNPPFAMGFSYIAAASDLDLTVYSGATAVAPRFFETHGIPVVAGREFSSADNPDAGLIINTVLAESLWPGTSAIGRTVRLVTSEDRDRVITGVVRQDRCQDMRGPPTGCAWMPFPASSLGYLRIRTQGDPMAFLPELRQLLRESHPDVALRDINTLETHLARLAGPERLSAIMAGAIALLGIAIVVSGCFSLVLSLVRERARDIAIRLAIGATPQAITGQVVLRTALLATVGAAIGAIVALGAAKALASQLFEVSPTDYLVFSCSFAGIIIATLLGGYWPARYAGRTDPAATLKYE